MDQAIHDLHIKAGVAAGKERTCGKKKAYPHETAAGAAAASHNRWEKRQHDVEPYPCAFCRCWHVGRVMSYEELQQHAMAQAD